MSCLLSSRLTVKYLTVSNYEIYYWASRGISYLIIFPSIIGFFRFTKIERAFAPFFVLVFFELLTEINFEILTRTVGTNSISSNFYFIVSFYIILWQLLQWGVFKITSWWTIFTSVVVLSAWIIENLIISSLWKFNSYCTVINAGFVLILSIQAISKISFLVKKETTKKLIFLMLSIWILKYAQLIITETSWIIYQDFSFEFNVNLGILGMCINGLTNLVYLLIAIWIPKKRKYSWLSP